MGFNTDKKVTVGEGSIASSTSSISKELGMYSQQIRRVEVHFTDEACNKDGFGDKRCMA